MHGEMTGWFEVRIDTALAGGAGKIHHRLFCRLDYEAEGRERPLLVAITGMSKAHRTTFTASDYAGSRTGGGVLRQQSPVDHLAGEFRHRSSEFGGVVDMPGHESVGQ